MAAFSRSRHADGLAAGPVTLFRGVEASPIRSISWRCSAQEEHGIAPRRYPTYRSNFSLMRRPDTPLCDINYWKSVSGNATRSGTLGAAPAFLLTTYSQGGPMIWS